MRDLHSNIRVEQTVAPILSQSTTDITGAAVDRQGFESVEHVALIGISGDTLSASVKVDVKLEHSDVAGSGYTAVTDANDVIGATPDGSGIIATIDDAAEDEVHVRVGYIGPKRYSRLVFDKTGTHTVGIPLAALAIKGHPVILPASDV